MSPTNLARLLGFLFIVVATFLSTVYIPYLERQLSEIESNVTIFEVDRTMEMMIISQLKEDFTRRRIELLESNLTGRLGDKKTQNVLLERAIMQTVDLAERWSTVFAGDNYNLLVNETRNEIKKIGSDEKLTLREKFDAVENVLNQVKQDFSKRLNDVQNKWHAEKESLKNQKEKRARWYGWFSLLQIFGLLFFSGAEIVDKFKK